MAQDGLENLKKVDRQIFVFGVTGVIATLVHVGVGMFLHHGAGLTPFLANIFAFLCAAGVTLFGNSRIAFADRNKDRSDLPKAAATILLGLALNQGLVLLITGPLAQPYLVALAVIIVTVPAVTFLLFKFWAFRD